MRAVLTDDFTDVDILTVVDTVEVTGAGLRTGMILVDEFGCPSAGLDVRQDAARGSGTVAFLVHDFDAERVGRMTFARSGRFRVMAQ